MHLDTLVQAELLRPIDLHFAHWIVAQGSDNPQALGLLAALVSQQLGEGHICIARDCLPDLLLHWPARLRAQALPLLQNLKPDGRILGRGEVLTPLVEDKERFYLYRYWQDECDVAQWVRQQRPSATLDLPRLIADLNQLFTTPEQPDWQKAAVATAVSQPFTLISGGPGTGKTTTVTKLLAVFLHTWLRDHGTAPVICLAAPTGKAAARLSESISQAKQRLSLPASIAQAIPEQGITLHRLLGIRPQQPGFRYHRNNPLHLDLLVVDEASMVDLPLMAGLLQAMPEQARLVLMGDRQQLASVEAGSVLADLCDMPQGVAPTLCHQQLLARCTGLEPARYFAGQPHPVADALAFLHKSYRFSADSGIGALARAVNQADQVAIRHVLAGGYSDISLLAGQSMEHLLEHMWEKYQPYFACLSEATPEQALAAFSRFQLLCGLRRGVWGVEALNQAFEQRITGIRKGAPERWYPGRAIMVTRNDTAIGLFNGDIGIALQETDGRYRVWFAQSEGVRGFSVSRLPPYETVFAMTVHKSQGSEFNDVTLLLADDNRMMSRELIYTGITRAKERCTLFGDLEQVLKASARPTVRMSGLAARIWSE